MPQCPACNGPVPATAVSCPHCNIPLNLTQSAASPRRDSSFIAIIVVIVIGVLLLGGILLGIRMFAVVAVRPKPRPTSTTIVSPVPASEPYPGMLPDNSEASAAAAPALPAPKLPE